MKIAVRYYTKTGNTKKLAEAIANATGVEAKDTKCPLEEDVDILFLGSSVYAAGVDSEVKDFIANINVKVGEVANFSTAAVLPSTYKQVKKLLDDKGIKMAEKDFACRGAFAMMHKNRPNDNDIKDAITFAKEIIGE